MTQRVSTCTAHSHMHQCGSSIPPITLCDTHQYRLSHRPTRVKGDQAFGATTLLPQCRTHLLSATTPISPSDVNFLNSDRMYTRNCSNHRTVLGTYPATAPCWGTCCTAAGPATVLGLCCVGRKASAPGVVKRHTQVKEPAVKCQSQVRVPRHQRRKGKKPSGGQWMFSVVLLAAIVIIGFSITP